MCWCTTESLRGTLCRSSRVFCAALFSFVLVLWTLIDLVSPDFWLYLFNSWSPLSSASLPCPYLQPLGAKLGQPQGSLNFFCHTSGISALCYLMSSVLKNKPKRFLYIFSLSSSLIVSGWEGKIGCCYSILIRSGSLSHFFLLFFQFYYPLSVNFVQRLAAFMVYLQQPRLSQVLKVRIFFSLKL